MTIFFESTNEARSLIAIRPVSMVSQSRISSRVRLSPLERKRRCSTFSPTERLRSISRKISAEVTLPGRATPGTLTSESRLAMALPSCSGGGSRVVTATYFFGRRKESKKMPTAARATLRMMRQRQRVITRR